MLASLRASSRLRHPITDVADLAYLGRSQHSLFFYVYHYNAVRFDIPIRTFSLL